MLLHWFRSLVGDELRIFVHPDYVLLTHLKREQHANFKQQIVHQQVLNVDLSEPLNQWEALKTGLSEALKSDIWQRIIKQGISAKLIISSHFARYAIIPWSAELAVEKERQAYMRYRFNTIFGDAIKAWDMRMSEPVFGQPTIASAVDAELLSVLHQVLSACHVKVASISPYLMLAINQSIQQIKQQNIDSSFWLGVIESERLCFALVEDGNWRLVKNVATETDVRRQIHTLIQREMIDSHVQSVLPVVIYQAQSGIDVTVKIAGFPNIRIQPIGFENTVEMLEKSAGNGRRVRI